MGVLPRRARHFRSPNNGFIISRKLRPGVQVSAMFFFFWLGSKVLGAYGQSRYVRHNGQEQRSTNAVFGADRSTIPRERVYQL